MAHKKYPALGRGLDALIRNEEVHTSGSSSINEVRIESIKANPLQPRREFDATALGELADSIREIGIIQPITVRDMGDGTFTIIAGERRWRASQMAGLTTIPAYIRTVNDENMMEMALVENIQRENLNAMEIALAYQHLIEQYNLTQERLSERVGKNRSTITNYLRLLKLPASVQVGLKNRVIDMGHARALLTLDDPTLQLRVYDEIQKSGMSVRSVEQLVKNLSQGEDTKANGASLKAKKSSLSPAYKELKEALSKRLKVKVQLTCSDKGRGKISIPFANEKELGRIIELLDQLKH